MIIVKGSKICWLYILNGSNVIDHSLFPCEDFYDKNKLSDLRSRHGRCLEVVLEHFNEFYMRQEMQIAFYRFRHGARSQVPEILRGRLFSCNLFLIYSNNSWKYSESKNSLLE